jgi:hypothetical protein
MNISRRKEEKSSSVDLGLQETRERAVSMKSRLSRDTSTYFFDKPVGTYASSQLEQKSTKRHAAAEAVSGRVISILKECG